MDSAATALGMPGRPVKTGLWQTTSAFPGLMFPDFRFCRPRTTSYIGQTALDIRPDAHVPPWKSNVAEGRRSYSGWCDENRKSAAAALSLTAMLIAWEMDGWLGRVISYIKHETFDVL